jgi:phospholipid/cholesterol/gamma-HCH transport system substrate-binding protein
MSTFSLRRFAIFVGLLVAVFGTVAAAPGMQPYHVKLDFTNVDGLVQGNEVTMGGVKVGQVDGLEIQRNIAVVTVSVDSAHAPLPAGTKALLRSLGLLGNKYVELIPGRGSQSTLPDGYEISVQSTTSPTDLDQINAIFDAPTREKLRDMTLQGAIALGGRAQTLNADLAQLRNLAVAATPVTGVLDDHQVALDRATVAFDNLTQKLAREDAALAGLVDHGSSLLATVQMHDQQLAGLLAHGDTTFARLDAILNGRENNLAGFFARQPSTLRSTDYTLNAGIPVLQATQPLIPSLYDLLYNFQDSVTGRAGTGNPNPDSPNYDQSTIWALRIVGIVCDTVAPNPNPPPAPLPAGNGTC